MYTIQQNKHNWTKQHWIKHYSSSQEVNGASHSFGCVLQYLTLWWQEWLKKNQTNEIKANIANAGYAAHHKYLNIWKAI